MRIIEPTYEIVTDISEGGVKELKLIERCARICYKSEPKTDSFDETKDFIRRIIKRGHLAMIEHSSLTVIFTCDRGISHEIVRHRVASFAQESTRWCNYSKSKFSGISVVEPNLGEKRDSMAYVAFRKHCQASEELYLYLTKESKKAPQEARAILPTCLKTELAMTANYREWRHFFELRGAKDAHPQVRKLANDLLEELKGKIPVIFDDL